MFTDHADERPCEVGPTWHDANVDALVWVQGYQVQDYGFAVGQQVTWPISGQLNLASLTETVGAATAAQISMAVDFYARRPEDTVTHTGVVLQIESYRCRHARGWGRFRRLSGDAREPSSDARRALTHHHRVDARPP
jgi:hypothetical protein